MKFDQPLQPAVLIKRYKRFLADVELEDGTVLTVHCPNSGSMLGCSTPGSRVMLSCSDNPKRKYPHTLEMVEVGETWVGINTSRTNHLVREALEAGRVEEIGIPEKIVAEVKTSAHTRLDFLLELVGNRMYMEVKNCTLAGEGDAAQTAMFPDAVTTRGLKHLHELLRLKNEGYDASVLFCVQRTDVDHFSPAGHIDPEYGNMLRQVQKQGVLVLACQADVQPGEIIIKHGLPVVLNP
jgi:sugar fermentation stimulation protein A